MYSADPDRAAEVADLLDTGMVWINSPTGSMADLPFGGTKRSGVGRELGPSGIDEFLNKKLIYARRRADLARCPGAGRTGAGRDQRFCRRSAKVAASLALTVGWVSASHWRS